MQYFTYIWIDTSRKMFYIGMHEGHVSDNYTSSSRWFNGEYQYRPDDFKRKVLKFFNDRPAARKEEARLLALIKEKEYGTRYYNLKTGRPKGTPASNKGKPMTTEQREKLSIAKLGKPSARKGIPNKKLVDSVSKFN